MITIKPFQENDFKSLLDLANQAVPFDPEGNKEWLEYRKAFDEKEAFRYHCLAKENGISVGYGCLEQQSEDPEWLRIFVVCAPAKLNGPVGKKLFSHLLERAREAGVKHLWAREYQRDQAAADFFLGLGFQEYNRFDLPDELPMVAYTLKIE